LGRSSRPSRCASSWREPNDPDTWIATDASGRSIEKFATFDHEHRHAPLAERAEQLLALVDGRRARDLRCVQRLGQHVDLIEVLADDEDLLSRVPRDEVLHHADLRVRRGGETVALVVGGGRVLHAVGRREVDAHLVADGRR
jgi:hypothetical protein